VNFGSRELKALNLMFTNYKNNPDFKIVVDEYVSANGDKAFGLFSAVTVSSVPAAAAAAAAAVQPTPLNKVTLGVPDAAASSVPVPLSAEVPVA
jgi:hypothetical protein